MQCVAATSALRAPVARAAAPRGGLRLPARPQVHPTLGSSASRPPDRPQAALGATRFPLPCSQVALRSSSLAGLRLEQHAAAAKAQRRAAVVVAAAEGEVQQLDPLET